MRNPFGFVCCVDCLHSEYYAGVYLCTHPKVQKRDSITGESYQLMCREVKRGCDFCFLFKKEV